MRMKYKKHWYLIFIFQKAIFIFTKVILFLYGLILFMLWKWMIYLLFNRSHLGDTVNKVKSLIMRRAFCWSWRPSRIEMFHLSINSQHVSVSETENDNSWHEPEEGQSLWEIGNEDRHFIFQVEVLFIVDMIWSHLVNKVVESASPTQTFVSLRLILSELFWSVSV